MLLEGVFPAATTPFYPDERLYLKKLEHNIEHYSRSLVAGVVVLGSTGEAVMLSHEESRQVLRCAVDAATPEKVLLAGVARESVKDTLRLIEYAAELHYDAALVRTPCLYPYHTLDILTYYRALADRSPLPIVLYSIPRLTHYEISVEMVAELAQHPNIVGIKDSSGSVERISALVIATRSAPRREVPVTPVFAAFTTRMARALSTDSDNASNSRNESTDASVTAVAATRTKEVGFQVLTGAAYQLFDSLQAGATGGVLAMAAPAPEACQEIYMAWKENDPALSSVKQQRLIDASATVAGRFGVPGIKYACELNGYFGGRPRLPLLALDEEQRTEVARAMADVRN